MNSEYQSMPDKLIDIKNQYDTLQKLYEKLQKQYPTSDGFSIPVFINFYTIKININNDYSIIIILNKDYSIYTHYTIPLKKDNIL